MVSPAALKQYGQDIARNMVGTGPFKFVEWRSGDTISFERNPDWWGGQVYLDKLIIREIPDPSVELARLQAGEVDFADGLAPDSISIIRNDPDLWVDVFAAGFNGYQMRCDRPPFNDKRVRQAMTYAIDRKTINDTLYQGLGVVANSPLPSYVAEHDESLPIIPYDPDMAKSLLSQAGYQNGFEFNLVTFNGTFTTNPAGGAQLAEAVAPYLGKVGIKANVQVLDIGAWRAAKSAGNFDMETDGREGATADNILYNAYHSKFVGKGIQNNSYYPDPRIDSLLDAGRTELDPTRRKAIYSDLQKYLMDLSLWIYFNYVPFPQAGKKSVMDVKLNTSFSDRAYRLAWANNK
jgi:peptide/nickel transport system substrate-binding protein